MDAIERLTLEEADAPSLIALTHLHRYEVAAELCAGMRVLDLCCGSGYGTRVLAGAAVSVTGVDIHGPTIERAKAALTDLDTVYFEVADALEYLERDLGQDFDAIVLLEGLEHLPDAAKTVKLLRSHAEAGMSLFVSIPNEGSFPEENPFHLSKFSHEDAIALCDGLQRARVLGQSHAEGSLIADPDSVEAGPVNARLALAERAEAEHFNHYLVLANMDESRIPSSSLVQLTVAPTFHRYMLGLERENRVLWRTNVRLARARLGVADSAAAAALKRIDALDQPEPAAVTPPGSPKNPLIRAVARLALNLLPHAVTLALMRHRERVRRAEERRTRLKRAGLPPEPPG